MICLKTITVTAVVLVGLSTIVLSGDNPMIYCDNKTCVELPEKEILKRYDNMFFTKQQIQIKIDTWAIKNKNEFASNSSFFSRICSNLMFQSQPFCEKWNNVNQNYDLCCASEMIHNYNSTMVNVNNKNKTLIRFINPDRRQFIPSAKCLNNARSCYYGRGTCRLHTISIWLLIVDLDPNYAPLYCKFEEFEIPGYCSCKTN